MNLISLLSARSISRESTILLRPMEGGGVERVGAMPLWLSKGKDSIVSVTWQASRESYRIEEPEPFGWTHAPRAGDVSHTAPPVDLRAGRISPVEHGWRATLEALALAGRFGLALRFGYRKNNGPNHSNPLDVRNVQEISIRPDRMVANDIDRGAPRSFLFRRMEWLEVPDSHKGRIPHWTETGYASP